MEITIETPAKPALPFLRAIPFLLGRKVPRDALKEGRDFSLLAMLLLLGVYMGRDWWLQEPERYFSSWGFAPYFTELFLLGAFCYTVSRSAYCVLPLGVLLSVVLEVYFFLILILSVLSAYREHHLIYEYGWYFAIFSLAWTLLSLHGVLAQALPGRTATVIAAIAGFGLLVLLPQYMLEYSDNQFWYHDYANEDVAEDPIRDYEQVFFSQDKLVQQQLDKVPPGVAGEIEFFYLGFGSYASQAVFKKEVLYIDRLVDEKYSTRERGVVLINHQDTLDEYPLAIRHNLQQALRGIAEKMNPEEDILLLYLTSHGSKDHELAVSIAPFRFIDLTPEILKQALDESGIRWKVVIISACYSGGFIEPLKDPDTLIATAADAEHKSFGCSNDNDFTYFGQALLHDQLAKGVPLLQALPLAVKAIGEREKREKKTPSNPQLWLPEPIVEHLKQFEAQTLP